MAPDLKTVADLKKYPEVFEDPEDAGRGRVINAPSGWAVADAIDAKFEAYDLDETMNNFMPGSDSAIVASLVDAYKNGEPWVGYYRSEEHTSELQSRGLLVCRLLLAKIK